MGTTLPHLFAWSKLPGSGQLILKQFIEGIKTFLERMLYVY